MEILLRGVLDGQRRSFRFSLDYSYEGLFVDTLARCICAGLRLKILDTFHSFLDRFEGTLGCALGTRVQGTTKLSLR